MPFLLSINSAKIIILPDTSSTNRKSASGCLLFIGKNHHTHSNKSIFFLQVVQIIVPEADATLAAPTRHRTLIVGDPVNADTRKARRVQAQEPVTV